MLTNCDDLDCPCTQLPQSTCTRDMFSCFSGRVVNISEHNTHLNCVDSFFWCCFGAKKIAISASVHFLPCMCTFSQDFPLLRNNNHVGSVILLRPYLFQSSDMCVTLRNRFDSRYLLLSMFKVFILDMYGKQK